MPIIEIIIEGGVTSGHYAHAGIPGHRGGSLPKGVQNPLTKIGKINTEPLMLRRGMFENMEMPEDADFFRALGSELSFLNENALPRTRWYRMVKDKTGQLRGYIIGEGRTILTILTALYGQDNLPSVMIEIADKDLERGPDARTSIMYQLKQLTDQQAARFYNIVKETPKSARELAAEWTDWSLAGLAQLLYVRSETTKKPEPKEAVD